MEYLLYCSAPVQMVSILIFFSGLSVLGLYLVRVLVPLERLKQNHEVAGFTFGVIGAFYGLLLAFVIVAAWERYDRADEQAQRESTALTALYRLSKGYAEPVNENLQHTVRAYARKLIDVEWPGMANDTGRLDNDPVGALGLWQIVATYKPESSYQQMLVDKSFDQLDRLTEARSLRFLYSGEDLPSVVWLVIYAGCVITIGFSYFFGLETFKSQALMCAVFSGLLGLTILAILELAHPYQGSVTVSDEPFRFALTRMDEMDKVALGTIDSNPRTAGNDAILSRRR